MNKEDLAKKIPDGALDEAVHDVFSSQASNLNNEGTSAQIDFLRENGYSFEEIMEFAGVKA